MALKDCIKKFSKTLDKGDRELLQSYLDQGLTDEQAVSRLELVLSKQLLDISLRAKKAGAAVRVKTDVLGEVRSYGAARLKVLRSELANIRNEQDLLSAQREEITWVESNIKHWEAGGQRIDLSNDTELYMRFEQMKFIHKDAFRRGEFGDGQIKGKDTYELVQSFRAMQERSANILSEIHGLLLREAAILEEMESLQGGREGVLDESGNYVIAPTPPKPAKEINVTYTTKLPWKISSSGEGDLYISRHGTKAGTPHKERQGPNDFAIKLDESLLDTNFTYYLLTYLQPKIAARAHGTAQQAIKKGDIEEVLIEHFKSQAREDSGTFYTNSGATTEQKVEEAKANYKAIVKVVEERTIKTGVTKVNNAADAAHVLAEIRKNASEGMWAAVLDAKNNVVGIVEHSRGTIDGTSVYPSTFAGAILTIPGAAKVWFAHNHPSGTLEASQADERITARMKNLMTGSGVEIQGHVIVGGGQANYTLMDPGGYVIERNRPITAKARNKSVKVFTRKIRGKQLGEHVTSPAHTERVLSDMGHPNGVLLLNNRHRVLGFVSMTADEMRVLKDTGGSNRLLKAFSEMNAAAFIVSTDRPEMDAANNMASFAKAGDVRMLDAIYKDQSGAVKSMAQQGTISAANTFYQSTIGFTSGLLTAVQTMSREKGTVAEMLGSLRKTTKIKKGKKKGELVTTYAPGVTKEEMNWLDFEEWAEARAAEPDAPLPSKRLQIRTPDRTTEVLQNPTLAQIALFKQSIRMEYEELGYSTTEDPMTRSTWDENGNRFLWASAEAVHIVMEEDLARHLGVNPATLSQHNEGKKPKASGTITRQEMIDYVSANGIVVEEVQQKDQQAYPGQSLEGGKAPRDIVLKMPEIPEDSLIHSFHIVKDGVGDSFITDDIADDLFTWFQTDERMVGIDASREGQGRRVKFIVENVTETQYDLIINYMNQTGLTLIDEQTTDFRAVDERQRQLIEKSPGLKENFPFSHFEHKNILAWIRTTERTGPNGERILMVEEIQSDWHQRGAKEERGYATPEKLE
jgi:DNA repair protein RadC